MIPNKIPSEEPASVKYLGNTDYSSYDIHRCFKQRHGVAKIPSLECWKQGELFAASELGPFGSTGRSVSGLLLRNAHKHPE